MNVVIVVISFVLVFIGNYLWRRQRFLLSQGHTPSFSRYGFIVYLAGFLSMIGGFELVTILGWGKGLFAIFGALVLSGLSQK